MADTQAKPQWPQGGPLPQRLSSNYARYRERGGLIEVTEDSRAYAGADKVLDKERFVFLSLAFDQIAREGLAGDIVELGVYQGQTATIMARNARRLGRTAWLMDTFTGFDAKDFTGADAGRAPQFTDTSLEAVRARVGEESTRYIQGFFPDTAAHLPPDGRYCLVHIDVDLYAPIMAGLEYFYPRMVPGGFLIIHDYGSLVWEGAEKAVDTFFADKPENVVLIPDSSGSAVIRRHRAPGSAPGWIASRRRLSAGVWPSAADGHLAHILTDGWSVPESWGTWGVGQSHRLRLTTDITPGGTVALDIDAHAFVWDDAIGRTMDVLVNDVPFTEVTFSKAQGLAPIVLQPLLPAGVLGTLTVEFRPREVAVPQEVDRSIQETRTLGLAVHRVRVRPLETL